jgi:hypothetical protein
MQCQGIWRVCLAFLGVVCMAGAAMAANIAVNYNLPNNTTNIAHIYGNLSYPLSDTDNADAHVWGAVPCHINTTYNPSSHAASATQIAFDTTAAPGPIYFENVSLDFGNWFTGANVSTSNLRGEIYTPGGTLQNVNPDGTFDNTLHRVQLNGGTAHAEGTLTIIPIATYDFNFASQPADNPGEGTAGPISFTAAINPHNISSNISTGYHVTYDYTTTLRVPINITKQIDNAGTHYGSVTITANLVTDPFSFSHTFDYLPGDCNLNGTVGFDDLTNVVGHYNGHYSGWASGDFNNNGTVDFADLTAAVGHYRQTSAYNLAALDGLFASIGGNQIPEPSSLVMVATLAAMAGAWRIGRRRRVSRRELQGA